MKLLLLLLLLIIIIIIIIIILRTVATQWPHHGINEFLWVLHKDQIMFHIFNLVVRFEVFTAVTMKNGVFWDVTPCGSCKNRSFGGT
jgi:hypothetical protein